jgi:hypothetical protein
MPSGVIHALKSVEGKSHGFVKMGPSSFLSELFKLPDFSPLVLFINHEGVSHAVARGSNSSSPRGPDIAEMVGSWSRYGEIVSICEANVIAGVDAGVGV